MVTVAQTRDNALYQPHLTPADAELISRRDSRGASTIASRVDQMTGLEIRAVQSRMARELTRLQDLTRAIIETKNQIKGALGTPAGVEYNGAGEADDFN